ncbi:MULTISPECIES: SDR family NAD(P)-dependent oxidoreductase [Erythrobacter]|uniref:SDR family NAD(P)-dependent oxidoreductase n=1 Tax=Erythrobacter aureus TaxID=2182384 RepID=A0A345YH02_9SPHN|nr:MULTISPECIES: SDR family oxidoreductase [Erythrobacter]AXK43204.1 SDR family NAD(P)-dependent oxidoreductase [Erythrobacter aureus]MCF8883861.1 SDR family oxidoreductase [Erythrobacter sp. SN021]
MSSFDLTGKVAVITGSSRGIGRAIAEGLAAQGARVVISSRKQDACEDVAAAINAEHGQGSAVAIAASISEKAQLEDLFAQTRERLGPVDILVCNAASNPHYGSMDGISDEQFRKVLDNNIMSNHWLIQLALPAMREKGDGAILVISSIGGLRASTTIGAYCVSKAADFQLVRNYAAENGKHGIRVNGIAPGLVKTDFAKALWDDPQALAATEKRLAMRRIGKPEDIAGAAIYLSSPAAKWTTGQTIVVDGGAMI